FPETRSSLGLDGAGAQRGELAAGEPAKAPRPHAASQFAGGRARGRWALVLPVACVEGRRGEVPQCARAARARRRQPRLPRGGGAWGRASAAESGRRFSSATTADRDPVRLGKLV